METTYYTIRAREIVVHGDGVAQASGGEGRRLVCTRQTPAAPASRRRNNVISLDEYRAAQDRAEASPEPETEPVRPAPRARSDHRRDKPSYLEMVTSAALIGVALSACAAFLL